MCEITNASTGRGVFSLGRSWGTNGVVDIGESNWKFGNVYATNLHGTVGSSSQRSMKADIHYLDENKNTISLMALESNNNYNFSTEDLIDFIKILKPCVFTYNTWSDSIEYSINNNLTQDVQLGLIADDIVDEKLFNFVGSKTLYTDRRTKEEYTTLELQPLPLAVLALSACKYLLNEIDSLKSEIESLKN